MLVVASHLATAGDLFIRHHPGHFVTRPCHGNVWKNWRAPTLPSDNDSGEISIHARDILNSMIKSIRSDLIFLIESRTSSHRKVLDSTTGISASPPRTQKAEIGATSGEWPR